MYCKDDVELTHPQPKSRGSGAMEKGKAPQANEEWPVSDVTFQDTKEDEVPLSKPITIRIWNFDKEDWPLK